MTIIRIERLIRRVKGVLQGSEPGGAQIAGDLAEVCREANRRIEECQVSLRRGDLAGALDLSEAEPALAEQIRALHFSLEQAVSGSRLADFGASRCSWPSGVAESFPRSEGQRGRPGAGSVLPGCDGSRESASGSAGTSDHTAAAPGGCMGDGGAGQAFGQRERVEPKKVGSHAGGGRRGGLGSGS